MNADVKEHLFIQSRKTFAVEQKGEKMTRKETIDILKNTIVRFGRTNSKTAYAEALQMAIKALEEPQWIPCSERLPESIRPVIVTWENTDPASYYQYIVGKHFTGTACYKNGKWYWYSSTTEDMLAEYGRYDSEEFDEAIECVAWMPLPEPYIERMEE